MKMNQMTKMITLLALLGAAGTDLRAETDGTAAKPGWSLTPVTTLDGFQVPECALWDGKANRLYVSNIESEPGQYWSDDGKGYLSVVGPDHRVVAARWLDSTLAAVIDSPKGMCLLGAHLYFTDNTRLLRCDAATGKGLEVVAKGFQQANDLATDGEGVWLSDTAAGKVYRVATDGGRREIPAPEGVNGLACAGGRLFAVSWALHDVYELDPKGVRPPVAYGLARHFTNLDGVEVLEDGSLLVSDFPGNQLCLVAPDRVTVTVLARIDSPADIGLDRQRGLLYVPQFLHGRLAIFRLERKP